jgi:hypothetical protein
MHLYHVQNDFRRTYVRDMRFSWKYVTPCSLEYIYHVWNGLDATGKIIWNWFTLNNEVGSSFHQWKISTSFRPEDGGRKFIRNAGKRLPNYTMWFLNILMITAMVGNFPSSNYNDLQLVSSDKHTSQEGNTMRTSPCRCVALDVFSGPDVPPFICHVVIFWLTTSL